VSRGVTRWVAAALVAASALGGVTTAAAARLKPPRGLPRGVASAALRPEPRLPVPAGWRFPDAFSRTSGTGRMIGGSFEWTDWVYDAYGASGLAAGAPLNPVTSRASSLTPAQGQYTYPPGKSHDNGADIFRAAVGLERRSSVWRVDWNTLDDASIPIAEWAFDTDADDGTGAATWAADANVTSPGVAKALVVSAKGARMVDLTTGNTIAALPTRVDLAARSFLVRVPRRVMPVHGRWRVRLTAGLADSAGTGFAVPTLSDGGSADAAAPRVYNVTFRTAAQEPANVADAQAPPIDAGQVPAAGGYVQELPNTVTANFWAEDDQAGTLAAGDVSKFSRPVDWTALARKRRTKPPLVKGWSERWLANGLGLGQGVAEAQPFFAGRVAPFAVYVPATYTGGHPVPLTWMLHSASSNYLQYAGLNPRMTQDLCEARGSICATPNGYGGGALYGGDVSEQEIWQVWRALARGYRVAADRTVVSGYSAGGVGSFRMSHSYPSAFAAAMPLDGGFEEACSSGATGERNFVTALAPDRSGNVRWVPEVMSSAYADELSIYEGVVEQAQRFQNAGDRFTLFSTTSGEHLASAVADGFSTQIAALGGTPRVRQRPGSVDYGWCPQVVNAKLGLGPRSMYWLSGLTQRDAGTPSTMSRVVAVDHAIPEPAVTEQVSASAATPADSPPMQILTGSWKLGDSTARSPALDLTLTNVNTVTVDTIAARLRFGTAHVRSDGPVTIALTGLARGTKVTAPGRSATAGQRGVVTMRVPPGAVDLTWRR
jgi:hypothetical protein